MLSRTTLSELLLGTFGRDKMSLVQRIPLSMLFGMVVSFISKSKRGVITTFCGGDLHLNMKGEFRPIHNFVLQLLYITNQAPQYQESTTLVYYESGVRVELKFQNH